jgi:hypothetical protein
MLEHSDKREASAAGGSRSPGEKKREARLGVSLPENESHSIQALQSFRRSHGERGISLESDFNALYYDRSYQKAADVRGFGREGVELGHDHLRKLVVFASRLRAIGGRKPLRLEHG